ncbi:MAG: hypothetical protein JO015_21675 [Verrucomicrobia bacterium]|nr:hypothetical protein [Verrucomicrobiota bacterium]
MSSQTLFDLLPAVYRLRDAQLVQSRNLLSAAETAQLRALQAPAGPLSTTEQEQLNQLTAKAARGPLQSLLMLIEEQLAVMAYDLEQLYDDQFIETCASWVIPYIGDLIGYRPVNGVAPAVASPRAEVANTISFRRRKGTVLVLEQLARDVTGWGAHAVEFFERLAVTQYAKHVRLHSRYTPDLRNWQVRSYMDTAFDVAAHWADVHRIAVERGRYNLRNVGIFIWSLNAYPLTKIPATAVDAGGRFFRFSPLGADSPLFNNPVSQGSDITAASQPVNVPDRLRRRVLCRDLQTGVGTVYYGEGNSLALYLNHTLLNPYQIRVCNLSGNDGNWANVPPAESPYAACVDPELGRIALRDAVQPPPAAGSATPQLQASFYYGFNAAMGAGEYPRSDSFTVGTEALVFQFPDRSGAPRYQNLQDALDFAAGSLTGNGRAAVEITDSGIYLLAGAPALTVTVPAAATIELRAADGCRPTLILSGEIVVVGDTASTFNLNGLMIVYAPPSPGGGFPPALLHVFGGANQLGNLGLTHCTLVPGWALTPAGQPQPLYAGRPALLAESSGLQITVQKSVVGGLWVDAGSAASLSDSIVDAGAPTGVAYAGVDGASGGGHLTLQSCTVIGKVHATLFPLVSGSILWAGLAAGDSWTAPVLADRKQQGCARFSYLPAGSVVPRQFECVEQGTQGTGGSLPIFYSLRYGDPGYAKLSPSTPDSIRRGADDGGEMGAFHFVLAPLRENDLRVRLPEYLPVGLEFGIFYQT